MMQIRRRYAKTRMTSMRRDHLPHNVRFLAYTAFRTRMQYGRRPVMYRWHFKKETLTMESLQKVINRLASANITDLPNHIYITY